MSIYPPGYVSDGSNYDYARDGVGRRDWDYRSDYDSPSLRNPPRNGLYQPTYSNMGLNQVSQHRASSDFF